MVFATGSGEKADAAAEIMNHHCAVEIEELSPSVQYLPSTVGKGDDVASGQASQDGAVQVGRVRSPGDGARLFVW